MIVTGNLDVAWARAHTMDTARTRLLVRNVGVREGDGGDAGAETHKNENKHDERCMAMNEARQSITVAGKNPAA